jgi:catechol 2,3-dioxygenase-like lactoylglutathione lyase family enzyme
MPARGRSENMTGIPGLRGTDHIGFTVPDLEEAVRFFVDVIGCEEVFSLGPFRDDDGDWMVQNLNVAPRAVIPGIRMLRCGNASNLEIFEYEVEGQARTQPRNSDVGGHHIAFYVEDIDASIEHLRSHGVQIIGSPKLMTEGPNAGLRWVYFLTPWLMQLELVSAPHGMAYEKNTSRRLWRPDEDVR